MVDDAAIVVAVSSRTMACVATPPWIKDARPLDDRPRVWLCGAASPVHLYQTEGHLKPARWVLNHAAAHADAAVHWLPPSPRCGFKMQGYSMDDRASGYAVMRRRIFKRVGSAVLFKVSPGVVDVRNMITVR